jgi:hypothetical protein
MCVAVLYMQWDADEQAPFVECISIIVCMYLGSRRASCRPPCLCAVGSSLCAVQWVQSVAIAY